MAPDGGLYLPVEIARHTAEELEEFRKLPFTEVCFRVVRPFATPDVPEELLWQIVAEAINFPVKLVSLSPALHILELFHGPTLAFKDFGARFMARLMGYFVRGESRQLTVLVATSGTDVTRFNARNLKYEAGNAVAYGMTHDDALRAVTLTPAEIFGLSDRIGSLQAGRDGNVVVWSGDPFEFSTIVEHVLIRGREAGLG